MDIYPEATKKSITSTASDFSAAMSSMSVRRRVAASPVSRDDVIQSVHTTVGMDAGREIVDRCIEEAEAIIRKHAETYGFSIIGNLDVRSRVRNDGVAPEVEVIVEARLRPRFDGVWGEIRQAIAEDQDDLAKAEAKRKFAPGGMITADKIVSGSITADRLYVGGGALTGLPDGSMHLDGSGQISVMAGGVWKTVGPLAGTVD